MFLDCIVTENTAAEGGGAFFESTEAELGRCAFVHNAGGGIVASGNPSATLRACAIEANAGSGLACDFSSPHVEDSTIAGNRAAFGGAIDSRNADPALFRCHLSGNMADVGGGVCTHDTSGSSRGGPVLVDSVVTGNRAGRGGAFFSSMSFPLFVNCTVAGNSAETEGGIGGEGVGVVVVNSILWGNTPPSAFGFLQSSFVDLDPLFVSPGVFDFNRFARVTIAGVPYDLPSFIVAAPDFHVRSGSPAIDAGDAQRAPLFDLDRNRRPCGQGVDIGAYETGACAAVEFKRGDANDDDRVNISDAVTILRMIFGAHGPPACADAVDVNDDGKLDIADAVADLAYLFAGGAGLPARLLEAMGTCGPDDTADALAPCAYTPCRAREEELPVNRLADMSSYFIVCSRSSSMGVAGPDGRVFFDVMKEEVIKFLGRLSARNRVTVVFYDKAADPLTYGDPPIAMTATACRELVSSVNATVLSSGACMTRGVESALDVAVRAGAVRASMILITNGREHCDGTEIAPDIVLERIMAANALRLPINTIFVGTQSGNDWTVGKPLLERIAVSTGGRFSIGAGTMAEYP